jgi:hypothetical protein
MINERSVWTMLRAAVLSICVLLCAAPAAANSADITGQWYGTWVSEIPTGRWASAEFPTGSFFEMFVIPDGAAQYWAVFYIPELGFFDVPAPMEVVGNQIAAGDPPFAWGTMVGDFLSGIAVVPDSLPPYFLTLEWQARRPLDALPGPAPGPECEELSPLYCTGSAEHCRELLPFSPAIGPGYLDYLVREETWEDQHRSYIRRDLMQLVKYAAAKLECRTADWDYGNFAPLGLGDMSQADGSTPTFPTHITHEDGNHIDIAYYQLYAGDNLLRPVCRRTTDGYYCSEPPYALDVLRTALFMARLAEHPHLRYILVDNLVGLALEEAFDDLEAFGWIEPGLRTTIPLIYEAGLYRSHYDHMHVTMKLLHPIVSVVELQPNTLNTSSEGKYITGHIELVEEYDAAGIDISTVALIVNGHTILYAEPGHSVVSDYNDNGVPDLTVKFDRKTVAEAISAGTVEMAIIGSVDRMFFQASDTIRVISPRD